ncbi:MAG TPA: GSU2403 family nucleotidyltransferase fold protein [Thermoanaerobaculia bacterium]|nr:GSU2403 family nucleotidyltransferase fold protein [Thermoanaerobaculia bacterium]
MDDDLDHFARLVEALRPYWGHLVIVGGWANRLYRYRDDAHVPPHPPLFTTDADIAIPTTSALPSDLRERLVASGFVEEFEGDDTPPVTHYRLGEERSGFYAEFLIPKVGGGGRLDKRSQHTAEIGGVVVQKLRYLEILLIEPWRIKLHPGVIRGLVKPIVVRVPNAVSYIAQKLLIAPKRRSADRAKDVLYVHDTIELLGATLSALGVLWRDTIRPAMPQKTAKTITTLATGSFSRVTDSIRDARAAAADAGRVISVEEIRARIELGLREIFAEE